MKLVSKKSERFVRKIVGEMKIGSIKSIFCKRYSNFLGTRKQAHYNIVIKTVIVADLITNRKKRKWY